MADKIKILNIITGLGPGGAENMLIRLLGSLDRERFDPSVISLLDTYGNESAIIDMGIPVTPLKMRPGIPNPAALISLAGMIRAAKPGIVQTWMYHADLLGGLAARIAGKPPVVWGIHHSRLDPGIDKKTTILTARACARLSARLPAGIVCSSESARLAHIEIGYATDKTIVILNGTDTEEFSPDPAARSKMRAELDIPDDAFLIGMPARFHPVKGHEIFIGAAAATAEKYPHARFLLCGSGTSEDNPALMQMLRDSRIENRFHLLGNVRNMARLYPALDLTALASHSESFPVTLAESMACGVPCVVTDVGDCAAVVGDTGIAVAPGNPGSLARAIEKMIEKTTVEMESLRAAARARATANYSIKSTAEKYSQLYEDITAGTPR